MHPCLSPGVCVTCRCPGCPWSLQELSHLLSSPFCGGSFLRAPHVEGLRGGGHRQAHALAHQTQRLFSLLFQVLRALPRRHDPPSR